MVHIYSIFVYNGMSTKLGNTERLKPYLVLKILYHENVNAKREIYKKYSIWYYWGSNPSFTV